MKTTREADIPCLINWIINYDEYDMPNYVQGNVFGKTIDQNKVGSFIHVQNIICMDIEKKTIQTTDGKMFNLIGDGKRLVSITNDWAMNTSDIYGELFSGF